MTNSFWQSTRMVLLVLTFGSAIVVLSKAIVTPKAVIPQPTSRLPATVPSADWQSVASVTLPPIPEAIAGQQYEYRRQQQSLTVQMRYMTEDGDVNRFLFAYTPIRQDNKRLVLKYQPQIGFYGVLPYQKRAYLSACISPRGESTVTAQQFVQNLRAHNLIPGRILPWLSGQQSLLDRRCLWTLMSVPLTAADSIALDNAYETLEDFWISWYRWWQPNFPPTSPPSS
ncbi:MAG: cyanoexosortase A system-associated protein [Stenomitos rutilans HA7619-LM2]|jgi:cyanosortase A-associated protein|nr:cyanoexosortase A system-associated protein [Stenomitos rutilans HA7619-LM2]